MSKYVTPVLLFLLFGLNKPLFAESDDFLGLAYPYPIEDIPATGNYANWRVVDFYDITMGTRYAISGNDETKFGWLDSGSTGNYVDIKWEQAQCLLNIHYQYNPDQMSPPRVYVFGDISEEDKTITNVSALNINANKIVLGTKEVDACL